ncbi:MAG: hypothetical protein KIG62_06500 [Oscillospiraceae bacterium]|nr:hypothetical protein [Oscillospiraceae bacterium]
MKKNTKIVLAAVGAIVLTTVVIFGLTYAVYYPLIVKAKADNKYRERVVSECTELFSRYPDSVGWTEEYYGTDIPLLADADYIDRSLSEGFYVGTAAELASYCWYINTQNAQDVDMTITADIDLSGYNWAPISCGSDTGRFNGDIDGGGHTITGLSINSREFYYGAFIGYENNACLHDITFDSAEIRCKGSGAVCIGEAIGGSLRNVTAVNCSVDSKWNGGALIQHNAHAEIEGCSADVKVIVGGKVIS